MKTLSVFFCFALVFLLEVQGFKILQTSIIISPNDQPNDTPIGANEKESTTDVSMGQILFGVDIYVLGNKDVKGEFNIEEINNNAVEEQSLEIEDFDIGVLTNRVKRSSESESSDKDSSESDEEDGDILDLEDIQEFFNLEGDEDLDDLLESIELDE